MFTWNDYEKSSNIVKDDGLYRRGKTIVYNIKREIEIANMDNISRTECYQEYYVRNSEIRWAF